MLSAQSKRFARLIFFSLLGIIITGCAAQRTTPWSSATIGPVPTQKNLQIGTFSLRPSATPTMPPTSAPTPQPSGQCALEGAIVNGCTCPANPVSGLQEVQCPGPDCDQFIRQCQACGWQEFCYPIYQGTFPYRGGCGSLKRFLDAGLHFCFAKPVVYLYPTSPLQADVRLDIPGKITVSDPHYPIGGWKQVAADPNGTLTYQGQKYPYLYYESDVVLQQKPSNGLVIQKTHLKPMLMLLTQSLGLLPHEQADFIDYWLPRLEQLNTNAVLFSVIDPIEKERIDHIEVAPSPETRIEFLAYFKPVTANITVAPLVLPSTPPQRHGFTVVEWGGTIDSN